jgi:hypothetical protein
VEALYSDRLRSHDGISIQDVSSRVSTIVDPKTEVGRAQLKPGGIAIYQGNALFWMLTPSKSKTTTKNQNESGKNPGRLWQITVHSPNISIDNRCIADTDHLTNLSGLRHP